MKTRFALTFLLSAACVWCIPASHVHAAPVPGQGTWETSLLARDVNHDGVADAYYDTALNVTWLADAFADTKLTTPGGRSLRAPTEGVEWAAHLDVYGITGWRLPKASNPPALIVSPSECTKSFPDYCGYNVDTSKSELAHMFYVTLGNKAPLAPEGSPQSNSGLTNTGPFQQLKPVEYWTASSINMTCCYVWGLDMASGRQYQVEFVSGQFGGGAWAVHDGDIASVPEPSAMAMLGFGLLGLGVYRRLRSH